MRPTQLQAAGPVKPGQAVKPAPVAEPGRAILTAEDDSLIPLAALQKAFHFWWFVFAMAAAGGLIAFLIHSTRPPVYEAVARVSASIDYVSTGPMSQQEEDIALNAIGDLLSSKAVMQQVVQQAAAQGIQTSVTQLKQNSVLERRVNSWDLRVRSGDAQLAERLANIWVEQGRAALLDGYQHALQAAQLNRYLLNLETCLSKAVVSEPVNIPCSGSNFAEIQRSMSEAGKALNKERLASRGIFSGLTIGPAESANLPAKPILFDRNQMVLAGCLVGFVLGILLVQLDVLSRWFKRS